MAKESKYKRVRYEDIECVKYSVFLKEHNVDFIRIASEIPTKNFAVINRLKREGWGKGPSDYFVFEPRGEYCGMFLEMKSPRNDFPCGTEEQKYFLLKAALNGYASYCCKTGESAIAVTETYLKGEPLITDLKTDSGKQLIRLYNNLLDELDDFK